MRSGRLDRRIDIQRFTQTTSDSGEPIETWADIATNRPASYRALKGDERYLTPQVTAIDQVEFTIRYEDALSNLNPKDRVVYPSRAPDSPAAPENDLTKIYDVLAVNELGRREGLQIIAERRPDQ